VVLPIPHSTASTLRVKSTQHGFMTRMIILAGAPESAKLDWSEKALLSVNHIQTAAAATTTTTTTTATTNSPFHAQWRQLATEKLQMRPVLPKLDIEASTKHDIDRSGADFFTHREFVAQQSPSSDVSVSESQPSAGSTEAVSEVLSEFYDHSFAIHEAIPSSQLSSIAEYTPGTPTYESNEEMFPPTPSSGGGIIRTPSQRRISLAPRPKHLSDLEDVPNAGYLTSIQPQTMTVNLIVAILSMAPPRMVTTGARYGRPREMELVELLVGDDTKTGFSMTMWLPREMHVNWKDGAHATPEGTRSALRRDLRLLRPRDVVLLQNVALSSFRGKVHGQSLKGDVTKVDLLFRKKVDEDDLGGFYSVSNLRNATDPQTLKVKKVRDWMVDFVGESEGQPRKGRRRLDRGSDQSRGHRTFPDDTQ